MIKDSNRNVLAVISANVETFSSAFVMQNLSTTLKKGITLKAVAAGEGIFIENFIVTTSLYRWARYIVGQS